MTVHNYTDSQNKKNLCIVKIHLSQHPQYKSALLTFSNVLMSSYSQLTGLEPISLRTLKMCTATPSGAITTSDSSDVPKNTGMFAFLKDKKVMKKIFPQTLMMFFILFNYTILRDTKDVLVVTAPKSGAEIIPFLKTYVQLPAAIAFTFLYSSLSNRLPQEKVFKAVVSVFLAFFGSFAAFIYPNRGLLHPNVWADRVSLTAPTIILPVIAIIR